MSSGLPSGTHCAHLHRLAFIVRHVGGASLEQGMATQGRRTHSLESSAIPHCFLNRVRAPSPSLVHRHAMHIYYMPGLTLVARTESTLKAGSPNLPFQPYDFHLGPRRPAEQKYLTL